MQNILFLLASLIFPIERAYLIGIWWIFTEIKLSLNNSNHNSSTHMTYQWEYFPIWFFGVGRNNDNFKIHKFDLIKIFAFSTLEWTHLAFPILCVLNMKRIDCYCLYFSFGNFRSLESSSLSTFPLIQQLQLGSHVQ